MIKYYKVSIIILSLICLIGCHNIKFEKYIENEKNIEDVYSRIFKTILENKV